jgi:hypothetical protein
MNINISIYCSLYRSLCRLYTYHVSSLIYLAQTLVLSMQYMRCEISETFHARVLSESRTCGSYGRKIKLFPFQNNSHLSSCLLHVDKVERPEELRVHSHTTHNINARTRTRTHTQILRPPRLPTLHPVAVEQSTQDGEKRS